MQADRKPNWEKWRLIPRVKLWEGVALSLDIDPDKVRHSKTSWMADAHLFEESREFEDRVVIAERNTGADGLHVKMTDGHRRHSTVSLTEFSAWALSIRWVVPDEFAKMSWKALGTQNANASPAKQEPIDEPTEKPLGVREKESLLKLVIGMAIKGYKYDPTASKNSATSEIKSDLEELDIGLDEDTVRKWLKEATTLIPKK